MRWKAIPSAQRDFQDGLVGEPGDWIDPEGETWWLDNAIAKHARKRTASGAWGEGGNAGCVPLVVLHRLDLHARTSC